MTLEHQRGLIWTLLVELERLASKYAELTDTDVREAIHLTLNYYYVWGEKPYGYPVSFGMFTPEGDRDIACVVERFLISANDDPHLANIPIGKARLDLLQDSTLETPGGNRFYHFLGCVDEPLPSDSLPRYLFEAGDYE